MNFQLNNIPERTTKDRNHGLTMVMDKGLSIRQAEDLIDSASNQVDIVKLGFGTSAFAGNVKEKVKLYQKANIRVYLGGTLFEAFFVRGQMDDYKRYIDQLGLDTVEISDGSISIAHGKKC